MRRTEQEFKAEVLRRSSEFKKRRKENIRRIALYFGCFAVLVLAVPMLPAGFGGSAMDSAAEFLEAPQAPEAAPEEPGEMKAETMYSTTNGEQHLVAEPEEVSPPEGVPVYEIQVSLYLSDGNWEEWIIRGEDRVRAVMDALRAFRDSETGNSVPGGISEMEGISGYTIFFVDHNEFYTFSFYADQDALWYDSDGGYWIGQDTQAAEKLMEALQKE